MNDEFLQSNMFLQLKVNQYNLIMKKGRVYEQNPIQNFQIEQQFQMLMQIEGLSSNKEERKEVFPSIKHLFHANTTVNIVGEGPNANIRSFYYLLLCHIRKEHFKRLLNEMREKELMEIEGDDDMIGRRDRKVSFNGKGAIFLNGPQYQNYGLHKLRMFIFSKSIDLMDIQNSPFQKTEKLRYQGQKLSSQMLKKLFSQFLKQLLPVELSPNYKNQIRSIRSYLNQHMCIGVILTILMRHILLSKYEVESARNYEEEINDHTVCTTLCDAFAIDGLICKDNLYEINTWCKVYSLNYCQRKIFFIEMFNDEFEELGSANDKKLAVKNGKQNEERPSIVYKQNTIQKPEQGLLRYPSSKLEKQKSEKSCSKNKSKASSSMMDADEDSQVSDETDKLKKIPLKFRAVQSRQMSSFSQVHSQFNSSICKSNVRENKYSQKMDEKIKNSQKDSYTMKSQEDQKNNTKKESQLIDHQKIEEQKVTAPQNKETAIILKDNAPIVENNTAVISKDMDHQSQQQIDGSTSFAKKAIEQRGNYDDGEHTPSDFFQKLNIFHDKTNVKIIKIGYRQDKQSQLQPNIVNNNINNNIYVNFGPNNDNKTYIPVINISTAKNPNTPMDPNSYIKINLS